MLNINSPTVQAMMQNLPEGVGNMPVYFGNTPTITTEQNINQFNTPYPSPKEMLMQSGQQNVYTPTSFAPRNIVGGYNPGFQAAFDGYVNPYMGYGSYGGYGYYGYGYPLDEETKQTLEMAAMNGLEYEEQIRMESDLYKKMSRTVSKCLGRTEEEAKRCEDAFEPYDKNPKPQYINRLPIKSMHIQIKAGDSVIADMPSREINMYGYDCIGNSATVDNLRMRDSMIKADIANKSNNIYHSAPERSMDDMDIFDFFNKGAGVLIAADLVEKANYQNMTRSSQLYNKERFGQRLLINNGYTPKSQRKAIDRFVGRYGVMPDGRPVSPGHDPAVAQSFSYDPSTGQYSITAPGFIQDRIEKARQSFINSID